MRLDTCLGGRTGARVRARGAAHGRRQGQGRPDHEVPGAVLLDDGRRRQEICGRPSGGRADHRPGPVGHRHRGPDRADRIDGHARRPGDRDHAGRSDRGAGARQGRRRRHQGRAGRQQHSGLEGPDCAGVDQQPQRRQDRRRVPEDRAEGRRQDRHPRRRSRRAGARRPRQRDDGRARRASRSRSSARARPTARRNSAPRSPRTY